jgi:hypothetical protein
MLMISIFKFRSYFKNDQSILVACSVLEAHFQSGVFVGQKDGLLEARDAAAVRLSSLLIFKIECQGGAFGDVDGLNIKLEA